MINKIEINNFKCFKNVSMQLRQLNVLCGINSGGKSSIIQSILLADEAMSKDSDNGNIDLMNNKYNMDLYSFGEILYEDANESIISIKLETDVCQDNIQFTSIDDDNNVTFKRKIEKSILNKIWFLCANRYISSYQKRGNLEDLKLGEKNEYLGYILERGRSNKIPVDVDRNLKDKDNTIFLTQVNEWLDYILPDNKVIATSVNNENMISIQFGKANRHKSNVGFGVSFALPIIVSGLLAKKGDILIVENPELHLHPKAQSCMAIFLSMVSTCGVQVIIETHSDHILNGIRRAIVGEQGRSIKPESISIKFFNYSCSVQDIFVDENAEISNWPEDFMDQTDKDLYHLRMMRINNGNSNIDRI